MMLDTIVLRLREADFAIRHPERFSPHAEAFKRPGFGGGKAIYNPTSEDKRGGYKPRLTLFRHCRAGHISAFLHVEFSAPKLIFGNNLEELNGRADLLKVIHVLRHALSEMGVDVQEGALGASAVSAIHYSKNIILDKGVRCFMLLRALEKLDLTQKLDLTHTDFRNGGQMVKYHASQYEIALYDKMKDLEQVEKYGPRRGAEKDYPAKGALFTGVDRKPEVLRFEVRMRSKKLKLILHELMVECPHTLDGLFDEVISRTILLHYWGEITGGLYAALINTKDPTTLVQTIRMVFPRKRPSKILEMVGFLTICQETGMRGAAVALDMPPSQLTRLRTDLKALSGAVLDPRFSLLDTIKNELSKFIPLTKERFAVMPPE